MIHVQVSVHIYIHVHVPVLQLQVPHGVQAKTITTCNHPPFISRLQVATKQEM